MKKLLSILLALTMLTAIFVGCAKETKENSTASTTGSSTASKADKKEVTRDLARFPLGGEVLTFDMGYTESIQDSVPIRMMEEPLMQNDPKGKIVPILAESWDISSDGLTYTFHLRKGVKFHDGTTMTADDVVFSMERAKIAPFNKAHLGLYVDKTEKVDDNTVKTTLKSPYGPLLQVLCKKVMIQSQNHYKVTSKGDENTFVFSPMGTGPYKFVKYETGVGVTLVAFDDYWGKKPAIKNIKLNIITDANAVQAALETDSLDFAGVAMSVPITSIPYFEKKDGIKVSYGGSTMNWHLPINCTLPGYSDKRVRQALAYALDRKFVMEVALGGKGIIGNSLHCPTAFGYVEFKGFEYSKDKAKALLAEAGYPDGKGLKPLQIVVRPDRKTVAETIQAMWKEVGVESIVDVQEASTYLVEVKKGNYGTSVIAHTPPLDVGMSDEWYSNDKTGLNRSRWFDQNVYDMLVKASSLSDPNARMDLYKKAYPIIDDAACYISMFYDTKIYVHNANLVIGETYPEGSALRFYECSWLPEKAK